MSIKGLKPAIARPSARDALAAADAIAQQAGMPPASLSPVPLTESSTSALNKEIELVQVNIRVRRALGDQLADRARTEGTTQKILICRALARAGFEVHPDDLKAMPTPRRRGKSSN